MANTLFNCHKRRRYTLKSPRDITQNQIDYIFVKARFRNGIKSAFTYPGADCDSNHNLVMMRIGITMKKIKKQQQKLFILTRLLFPVYQSQPCLQPSHNIFLHLDLTLTTFYFIIIAILWYFCKRQWLTCIYHKHTYSPTFAVDIC